MEIANLEAMWTDEENAKGINDLFNAYYQFTFLTVEQSNALLEKFPDVIYENTADPENEDEQRDMYTHVSIHCETTQRILMERGDCYANYGFVWVWCGHGYGYAFNLDKNLRFAFRHTQIYRMFMNK
jgi:hypothetical protein